MNNVYKHSEIKGSSRSVGMLLALLFSAVFSVLYAFLRVHFANHFTGLFLVFVNLLGIAISIYLSIKISKCRNTTNAKNLGKIVGVVSILLNWPCYVFMEADYDTVASFLHGFSDPFFVLRGMNYIASESDFTFFGMRIAPVVLWGIWVGELIIIYLLSNILPKTVLSSAPYCEYCDKWISQDVDYLLLACHDKSDCRDAIEHDIDLILNLEDYNDDKTPHFKVSVYQCANCANTSALEVTFNYYEYANYSTRLTKSSQLISPLFALNQLQVSKFMDRIQQVKAKKK